MLHRCTVNVVGTFFEEYVPPEGDGIVSAVSGAVSILTTNLAAVVCVCVCVSVQNLTNFCPHALISTPNVPKILFA